MNANVCHGTDGPGEDQRRHNARPGILGIDDGSVQHRRASHGDRQRMLARFARSQGRPLGIVVRGRAVVLVCREPVVVFGMIVIDVGVYVQRRDLPGRRGQHQSEQD